MMTMSEEEYDFEDMSQDSDDPQWSSLTTEQKKELMVEVFDDDEWYSGTPAHIGGTSLPEFGEIASRLSAPKSDIMKYYAAWVKTKGLNPQEVMSRGKTMEPAPPTGAQPPAQQEQPMMPPPKVSPSGAGVAGQMKGALMNDMLGSMFGGGQQSGGGNDMKYMMGMMMMSNMLESERRQHEAQMQIQREQFAASQNNSIRQEQQQRQDMMMTQQMNFMNNMFKQGMKSNEDEFSTLLKTAAMEKVADNLFGGSESTAERILSKVLDPDALGAVVAGAKGVMTNRQNAVPAGYDVPSYNPYAQPLPNPAQQPPAQAPQQLEEEGELGGFFEGPEQEGGPTGVSEVIEVTDAEFRDTLIEAFKQNMGPQLEDEKTRKALLEQIDIAVSTVKVKYPELTPQNQLEKMSQQLILVRSLRDIGMGMREAQNYLDNGVGEGTVVSGIKDEIIKQPVFAQIFAENTYTEMMGIIEPYKNTGGVVHDYNYLLQPEIANLCRKVLESFKQG
tara:strand:+ start:513 stop:2018 length:1506 start_codon:yes stop_codon:yes gene_type:complete